MKSILLTLAVLPLWLCASPSNPSFYLKLDDALVTNSGTKFEIAVYMAGSTIFNLGSCNLEFLYDSSLLETPVLLSHELNTTNYLTPTVTCPTEDKTALNIVLDNQNMGDAIATHPSWTKLATLQFDIKASGNPLDLCWSYDGGTKETVAFLDDESTQIFVANPESDLNGVAQMFLPVELIDFSAQWGNENQTEVLLNWQTASENNSDYFEIQRSEKIHDWNAIGQVLAQGFSTEINRYFWKDFLPPSYVEGQVYYRLKQVDFDGSAKYSPIEILVRKKSRLEVNVYPTIFQNELFIDFDESDFQENDLELFLINVEGKIVYTPKVDFLNELVIDNLHHIPSGFYFLKIKSENIVFSRKLLKI